MPIPERFQTSEPSELLVNEMTALCEKIEHELECGGDAIELLNQWREKSGVWYEPHEFENYWRSIDIEEFVLGAINGTPEYCADLNYAEAKAVLETILNAELAENQTAFYLDWLETQFPNSSISDLIYWPDEWFDDSLRFRDEGGAFKPEAELDLHQILAYAMTKSNRYIDGRPSDVNLPYPLPPES